MGKTFNEAYFENLLQEAQEKCFKKAPVIKSSHRAAFVEACKGFQESSLQDQQKAMKKCVKAANKILEKVNLMESSSVVDAALKGTIIMKATPKGLADFANDNKRNGKLIDHLLKTRTLMKEMVVNGGAKDGNYASAMKIYTQILADFPDDNDDDNKDNNDDFVVEVNRKIAMAVALELATPINEFDTETKVDPVERFKHFSVAYQNGELDPVFPHLSIWELRHVVNCDAPNDQMKWGRDMLLNYAPYMTVLTDQKSKYNFILDTDVLMRNPNWTSSPRTYQQVLSGGGKDKPNAWFGRFICKAHGIPTWGCINGDVEGFTRWTSSGWEPMMKSKWDDMEWEGIPGIDFKGELDARNTYSEEDYYSKLVLLECFANVMDGRHLHSNQESDKEKAILHPLHVWRSLSIIQKALMLNPASPVSFERTGEGGIKTRLEKYLERFEIEEKDEKVREKKGNLIVPCTTHGYTDGPIRVITSFKKGKQLNLLGGASTIEFDTPDEIEGKNTLQLEVCTVHLKQNPLYLSIDEGEKIPIEIPYTVGEWQKTKGIQVDLSGGEILRFSREKTSYGMAIKNLIFS